MGLYSFKKGIAHCLFVVFPQDTDECELNETQCEELCINTEGSYQCDCSEGYQLVGTTQCEGMAEVSNCASLYRNNHVSITFVDLYCVDVDECTENLHDCEQVCENTVGTYNCSCEPGFNYSSDGRNCTGRAI